MYVPLFLRRSFSYNEDIHVHVDIHTIPFVKKKTSNDIPVLEWSLTKTDRTSNSFTNVIVNYN